MSIEPNDPLARLLYALQGLQDHVQRHPLDYVRWTIPQLDYLKCDEAKKLLRMGNRGGKSFVALADVFLRAKKCHPYRPDWNARRGAQHQAIVSFSWTQLQPLMRIFHSFIGPDDLASAPNWSYAKGWGKDAPTLVFRDGSTVTWRTMRQGTLAQAGSEYDHILKDEPGTEEEYRELDRRVSSTAGELSIVLTPVNAPGPLDWLRDLATTGIVHDMPYPMTEDLFRYADDRSLRTLPDGTLLNKAWIDEQVRTVLPRWREIILHGGWDEIVTDGEFIESFSFTNHVANFKLSGKETLFLGIDHGTKAYTETAVLGAVDENHEYPHVYIIDCYEAPANSPAEKDAQAILKMLRDNNLKWSSLSRVVGDIPHNGGRGRINRKSNLELAYEIARELGLGRNQALVPYIGQAKTGRGSAPRTSIFRGETWLHRAMLRPKQFTVHPRCTSLIEAFEKYRGGSTDPHGHLMDALRYGLDHWINKGQTRRVTSSSIILP